jgi:hypothetical protein
VPVSGTRACGDSISAHSRHRCGREAGLLTYGRRVRLAQIVRLGVAMVVLTVGAAACGNGDGSNDRTGANRDSPALIEYDFRWTPSLTNRARLHILFLEPTDGCDTSTLCELGRAQSDADRARVGAGSIEVSESRVRVVGFARFCSGPCSADKAAQIGNDPPRSSCERLVRTEPGSHVLLQITFTGTGSCRVTEVRPEES